MVALAASMAAAGGCLYGEPAGHGGLPERLARVFSPEMRRAETRLGQVAGQLASLPELLEAPLASRYGYRSENLFEQERAVRRAGEKGLKRGCLPRENRTLLCESLQIAAAV